MIVPTQSLRIVLAVRPVDFRCGPDALAGLVQNTLGLDPHSGLIVVFRSKRMDRLKILLWDGTGLVLVYKRLGEGHFVWPQISEGVLHLTRAQFEALFDGLNWKRIGSGSSQLRLRQTDSHTNHRISLVRRAADDRFTGMPPAVDPARLALLPDDLRALFDAQQIMLDAERRRAEHERAARLHVESELAVSRETVERLELLVKEY